MFGDGVLLLVGGVGIKVAIPDIPCVSVGVLLGVADGVALFDGNG